MGLGHASVKLNLELWRLGYFSNFKSIVEMGAQEIHMPFTAFQDLIRSAGVTQYDSSKFDALNHWPKQPRCPAKNFYELLGLREYRCIDVQNLHGAIPFDLNQPMEDTAYFEKFDLVTDYGTNEHIFNTAEAYRTMHKLCRPGGMIIIGQALYNGNGYYCYEPSFFEGLAAANHYKILFCSYVVSVHDQRDVAKYDQFLLPLHDALLDVMNKTQISEIGICYVMQKQESGEFHIPYQSQLMSERNGYLGLDIGYFLHPTSRSYLPVFSLEHVRTKHLLTELEKRARRNLFRWITKFSQNGRPAGTSLPRRSRE